MTDVAARVIYWCEGADDFECCVCGENDGPRLAPVDYGYRGVGFHRRELACGHMICTRCLYDWMMACARRDQAVTCPLDRSIVDFDRITIYWPRPKQAKEWPKFHYETPQWRILHSGRVSEALNHSRRNWPFQSAPPPFPQATTSNSTLRVIYAQTGSPTVLEVEVDFGNDRVADVLSKISSRIGLSAKRLAIRFQRTTLSTFQPTTALKNHTSPIQLIIS